tara:strand:- start:345 stop:2084 length:1740 start_codon:yes stop_codon:yes gene_type:complete
MNKILICIQDVFQILCVLLNLTCVKNIIARSFSKFRILLFTIFTFFSLLYSHPLQARPTVGVLSVDMFYPSKGLEWLELFIQEEISLQLQLSERFSVISPSVMSQWHKRINVSNKYASNLKEVKKTKISLLNPDRIFKLSLQKVLNKLSVNWGISKFEGLENILEIKGIHSWSSPDELVASLLKDLVEADKLFSGINHYRFYYSWEGIQSFYRWRQKTLPKVNSESWKNHKKKLESILLNYPEMSSHIKYCRAVLKILESSLTNGVQVNLLDSAEKDLVDSMKSHPGNADHHNLLSLVYFLRKENLFAKQQANIANKINHSNGLSLILYGLTIGKNPEAGENYIIKGLRLYPFVGGPYKEGDWQPFHLLKKYLEPWTVSKTYEENKSYDELLNDGKEFYKARIWKKAIRTFRDANTLKPLSPKPLLYLAKIELGQNKLKSGLEMLKKLSKKFPKNTDITLYLGYANEKLKFHLKAESLYRAVLSQNPESNKTILRLSAVLIKLDKLQEARSFLESLTQKYPSYTVAWWNLGIVYFRLGEFELAEIAWEESLRLEPENGQVRLTLEKLRDELAFKQFQNL